MPRRLEKLLALTPSERWLLVRLMLLLPAVGAALQLIGFKRIRDVLARLAPSHKAQHPADPAADTAQAQRIARLVSIAANHGPYRATCLRQSLTLWWLLRRCGIPAELRIGVRKEGGNFLAHAWVEHRSEPLSDVRGAGSDYAVFSPSRPAGATSPQ